MQLKDVPVGAICYMQERIGDDRNAMEVRETFYMRDADTPCRYPHNVRIGRIGVVQGDPDRIDEDAGRPVPRSVKCSGTVCRDPGEADGRTTVRLLSDGESRWWKSVETVRLLKGDAPIQSQA
jgi:hypothetical protein